MMEDMIDDLVRRDRKTADPINQILMRQQEFVSVWVRDPQIQREDFWHAHIDYEICIHTNSMCFTKKTSCVRRRYSEFVWLKHKLQQNALLMELPELPPKNPFFSLNNAQQVGQRMRGLQQFLEVILLNPVVLSDSCLHLFLQSQLNVNKMEACAAGQTRFSVDQAIQRCGCKLRRFHSEEELRGDDKTCYDSDCERCCHALPPQDWATAVRQQQPPRTTCPEGKAPPSKRAQTAVETCFARQIQIRRCQVHLVGSREFSPDAVYPPRGI
ncbi:hypothetical protein JZ751_009715 [Albula glossodonta]|uniref:PX domain-containing protein n=1 Tax=Albula glossodonta TaxID=121402 RepID=A0A8T2P6E5_9TELE|nr:hypothetical protein JZ751_009715 [Albula glossodonta]